MLEKDEIEAIRDFLTENEFNILLKTEEEIKDETRKFSFDTKKFDERILTSDRWQQLLQGHLYIDHVITNLVSEALERPDAIKLNRMGFSQKIQLTRALGLLGDDILSTIEFINNIRNRAAHDLTYEITDKEEKDLSNCIPKWLREAAADNVNKNSPMTFRDAIRAIVIMTEVIRQNHAYRRLIEEKATTNLKATIEFSKRGMFAQRFAKKGNS